ncbi:hypothetical protein AgCh_006717 [Apium graveolens]
MKEAIRMVLESIYDPEFPDTSHFRSGRGCHSALRRIKGEWGTSRWFLEFDIRKCFHTIDRHRLIPIFKEEIDDPKFFYPIQKVSPGGVFHALAGPLIRVDQGRTLIVYGMDYQAMAIHLSLRVAPLDLQQGGNSRIPYVHVPAAKNEFLSEQAFSSFALIREGPRAYLLNSKCSKKTGERSPLTHSSFPQSIGPKSAS